MVEFRARWRFAPSLHLFALREIDAPELPLDTSDARSIPRLTPRQQEVLQLAAEGRYGMCLVRLDGRAVSFASW